MYLKIPISAPGNHEHDLKRERLMTLVVDAHMRAARHNAQNASSAAFVNSWANSRNIQAAIASGILATGGAHAPVTVARFVYETFTEQAVQEAIEQEVPICGFGNSFFKGKLDPSWSHVVEETQANWPKIAERINTLEQWIRKYRPGRVPLLANAAMFTAAACSECGLKHGVELTVLYASRIQSWLSMISDE